MSRKRKRRSGNPDLRRGVQVSGPPLAEIEALLWHLLTPSSFNRTYAGTLHIVARKMASAFALRPERSSIQ